jgi:hypothetical protein
MRALLINTDDKTITEVHISEDNFLDDLYSLIQCNMVEAPYYFPNRDTIYIDEEGLFNERDTGFSIKGATGFILVGFAVVLGSDDNGGDTDCKSTIEDIKKSIVFLGDVSKYKQAFND